MQHCTPETLALAALREPLSADDATHLEECAESGPGCALDWLQATNGSAAYLFVPAECCAGFRSLALADPRFAAVHQVGDAVILRITGAR